jgi:tripartite-type tricarboxylate transporter receptor subunit TctC
MQRRFTLRGLAATLALASLSCAGMAQNVGDYPNRPIKLVVNLPPGGAVDTFARLLLPQLTEALGKTVVIDYRAGAGGTIGSNFVAKAPADGYTVLMVYDTYAANPHVYKDLPFDSFKDLTAVTILATAPLALVVPSKLAAENLKEFTALSKSKPNGLNYASGGAGSSGHLTAELFASAVGANITHVPYKGGGPALMSVVSAETDMTLLGTTIVVPQVRNGLLKAIAVTSKDRAQSLPNVPTVREQGYPEFEVNSWYGVLVPAGTPRPIVEKVRNAFLTAMKHPPTVKRMAELDITVMGVTPERADAFIVSESARWGKVVKDNNIKLE